MFFDIGGRTSVLSSPRCRTHRCSSKQQVSISIVYYPHESVREMEAKRHWAKPDGRTDKMAVCKICLSCLRMFRSGISNECLNYALCRLGAKKFCGCVWQKESPLGVAKVRSFSKLTCPFDVHGAEILSRSNPIDGASRAEADLSTRWGL